MPDPAEPSPRLTAATQIGLRLAEDLVYIAVALLLVVGAVALLGSAARGLLGGLAEDVDGTVQATLDTLLLIFILVELLSAVRSTLQERKLLAEPFLIVGIIASIKEIVVVTIEAKDLSQTDPAAFDNAILEIGVLGGLVLALAVATWLARLKEREPEE